MEALKVHCRTGSLEISVVLFKNRVCVHCRTGSLEKYITNLNISNRVHCRTGSLENLDEFVAADLSMFTAAQAA